MARKTYRKNHKIARKTKRRYNRKYHKKGGMPPPIMDAATYSYPPYFPNKGPEGKDVWPVKFSGFNLKDVNVPDYKQFPLGADVIIGVKEQAGDNNLKVQAGGYVYDARLLRKPQSYKKQKLGRHLMIKKIGK